MNPQEISNNTDVENPKDDIMLSTDELAAAMGFMTTLGDQQMQAMAPVASIEPQDASGEEMVEETQDLPPETTQEPQPTEEVDPDAEKEDFKNEIKEEIETTVKKELESFKKELKDMLKDD